MMVDVKFDKHSLIIDGKETFIRSGAFHYFRSPGMELTKDRFLKMKSGGYNTVDIYFNWNYHSPSQGVYDFSGVKDVRKILEIARECGLFVIARPGPFINAETNAGGLPFWLLKNKDVVPRNRIGSQYQYSEKYMAYVREWYDQIIPIISDFDNIIAFQIENEYATDEMDEAYMKELYDMAKERGISCPIFHNDAYCAGLWADVVDIYACDVYPYINPNQDWKKDHFCFDTLDNLEDMSRMSKPDAPMFIAEMQGGWFDKWDGNGYEKMRAALGDEHINIMTKGAVSQGVTMFNHYMAVGGTSWEDLACDEVYTSYEFTAGIDEYGNIHPNFYKAKEINYFLESFGLARTDKVEEEVLKEPKENVYAIRRSDEKNGCNWIFVRNLNACDIDAHINPSSLIPMHQGTREGKEISLSPYDMKICAENLKLLACDIEFSDCEIFSRLKNETDEVVFMIADKKANIHLDFKGEKQTVSAGRKDYENLKYEHDGKTTQFVFLSKELADRTWMVQDRMIFNADFVYPDGTIALSKTREVAYFDLKYGFSKKYFTYDNSDETISIKDFEVSFCAQEIDLKCSNLSEKDGWKKVEGERLDSLSIENYDEFVWYKALIPDSLEEITLSARHLFALYINGKEVLNRNSYKYEKLQQIEEIISLRLDKNILSEPQNEMTILVQNLGFDKGFSGETNYPRGLVDFKTVPEMELEFFVNEKLSIQRKEFERENLIESESPYLMRLTSDFSIKQEEDKKGSKYLWLKDFPYDRATIFVNGVKLGRYLKNNRKHALQDKFYLIDTFLKEENLLDIVVWGRQQGIKTPWDFKSSAKHVIIQVGNEYINQLY